MNEKKDIKSEVVNDLLIGMDKTLDIKMFNTILDGLITDDALETNELLTVMYNTLDKDMFNTVIEQWVAEFLKDNLDEIVTDDALETIKNYHDYLKELGYFSEQIKVEREEGGIVIKMQGGCPYGVFCKNTDNQKCIRGSALNYLLTKGDNGGNNKYAPMLEKFPTKEGYLCKIHIKTRDNVIDSIIGDILGKEKHVL